MLQYLFRHFPLGSKFLFTSEPQGAQGVFVLCLPLRGAALLVK
jgi:hypothetical protein